ncbi:hypothetical protein [Streptomyces sp. WM6378]|uniref:hypothetical protein n=1 Tax=Streptomyces sp. WM6378 TaxID=1415557 RepID=UPI0006AF293A|nr:hypothetical protein [Streptomyces sp. WM6378]KOU53784.1 hypothetical protein ADK54_03445 [Streptomyces sp. WM6378]
MIAVFGVLMVGMPYLQARQFHKLTVNYGEYRATIADTGVTIAHQQATTTLTWQAAPRYVGRKYVARASLDWGMSAGAQPE